jgi:Uncharacterized protein conserved in bacteria (DUF2330)
MSSRLFRCVFAAGLASWFGASRADACGGFFCSASPVDQSAERIVFAVDEQSQRTEMIVQITYQGADDAFAWLLPVAAVPENRAVFPNGALVPLDAQTGPSFVPPDNCPMALAVPRAESGSNDDAAGAPGVTILVRETVGPYDVVVLESADAAKTFAWLTENKYRLAPAMKPYLELYTAQGMKFLALKLTADATVQDIQPFRMTLPGTTPSIPLRLTAVAAEPEMGIVVWILGARRYEPANAPELDVPSAELKWSANSFPIRTNWPELVARKVDEQGGRGWVVEQAGASANVSSLLSTSFANTPDQIAARDALLGLFVGKPYMTRLYTRLSPEEMSYDPLFKQSDKPAVDRQRTLPYSAAQCSDRTPTVDPCDFTACGQLGLCAELQDKSASSAGCACAPGSTARAIAGPQGVSVNCQDQRMSFMNPGDRDDAGNVLADPCVGYDCGAHGRCVAMNLTPTCECEQGFVATASANAQGQRLVSCQVPARTIATGFYNRRPPALAPGMVAGRTVALVAPQAQPDVALPATYGEPTPAPQAKADSGCRLAGPEREQGALAALFAAMLFVRRRRLALLMLRKRRAPV